MQDSATLELQQQITLAHESIEAFQRSMEADENRISEEVDKKYSKIRESMDNHREDISSLREEIDEMSENFDHHEKMSVKTGIPQIDKRLEDAIKESGETGFVIGDIEQQTSEEEEGISY